MVEQLIKTSKNKELKYQSGNADVAAWFNNPENHTDTILKQINEERMYDPIFTDRNNMVVVDLGANCGLFSLYAADSCSQIIAVEPTPSTYNVLTEIVKDHNAIKPIQLAIGPVNETVSFYLNENSTTNSMLNRNGIETKVQSVTIDSLLDKENLTSVDFIKCDIEGSEMQALTDATLGPVADRVKFWFVEVHQTDIGDNAWPGNLENNRQQLAELFQRHGYQTESVIHDRLYAWK
jgi:FkbM family methyltransferase